MKKNAILIAIGLLVVMVFVGHAARVYRLDFVDQMSSILYDYRLRMTMPQTVDDRIVIIDLDEKTLKKEGRWPWGRDRMALLMDKLFDKYGIAVLGFDVVFAERDDSSGLKVLQKLGQNQLRDVTQFQAVLSKIEPQLDYDNLFANKIKNRKVVLGYYFNNQSEINISGKLPEPVFPAGTFKGRNIDFISVTGYGANLPELQKVTASAGHFNPKIDPDGRVRRVPMLEEYGGAYYESLSLAVVRTLFGQPKLVPGFAEENSDSYSGLEWLELEVPGGKLTIPVDGEVTSFVPYRGGAGSFPYISITDVLHDNVAMDKLQGKIVLMGTTAPGLLDLRATPVSEIYPGVEVHANMISGILDQNLKAKPAYMLGVEVIWLLVIGAAMSFLLPRMGAIKAVLVTAIVAVASTGINVALWQYGNIIMPAADGLIMLSLLFTLNMSYGYLTESRTKRQITGLFGQYVPKEVVEEMAEHPESVSMEGDSREMSILFSDVRGFTTISEGLDAKDLSLLMNEFLTPLSRIIYQHRGTIDKYMGDCIMAFWGAPLSDAAHARNAILAGIEMQETLKTLRPQFRERGWPDIYVGVGINTGRVNVGNMGSEVRVAYTVMGDEVNLASRLEGITKQYGVGLIVGENTKNAVPDFLYREIDHVRVKGKDKPVAIYEPIGLMNAVSKDQLDEVKLFHEVRRLYRKRDWDQAELQLMNLQTMSPTVELYQVYKERIDFFRKNPPVADWDGVYVHQNK